MKHNILLEQRGKTNCQEPNIYISKNGYCSLSFESCVSWWVSQSLLYDGHILVKTYCPFSAISFIGMCRLSELGGAHVKQVICRENNFMGLFWGVKTAAHNIKQGCNIKLFQVVQFSKVLPYWKVNSPWRFSISGFKPLYLEMNIFDCSFFLFSLFDFTWC